MLTGVTCRGVSEIFFFDLKKHKLMIWYVGKIFNKNKIKKYSFEKIKKK